MTYNFTKKIQKGHFDIQIDEKETYGYFEHDELGDECGGGLWFEKTTLPKHGETLTLIDYDGVGVLPKNVCRGLVELSIIVPDEFWPNDKPE